MYTTHPKNTGTLNCTLNNMKTKTKTITIVLPYFVILQHENVAHHVFPGFGWVTLLVNWNSEIIWLKDVLSSVVSGSELRLSFRNALVIFDLKQWLYSYHKHVDTTIRPPEVWCGWPFFAPLLNIVTTWFFHMKERQIRDAVWACWGGGQPSPPPKGTAAPNLEMVPFPFLCITINCNMVKFTWRCWMETCYRGGGVVASGLRPPRTSWNGVPASNGQSE